MAYLNLKDAAQAVKQYERRNWLREANQGVNDPDTASCRNQLAVAYRLAGRIAEASRLFDRNDNSPTHAAALYLRGSMLLLEKNPAEAELETACLLDDSPKDTARQLDDFRYHVHSRRSADSSSGNLPRPNRC